MRLPSSAFASALPVSGNGIRARCFRSAPPLSNSSSSTLASSTTRSSVPLSPLPIASASRARLGAGVVLLAALAACTPEIGDKCQVSTDCSIRGDRLCDLSQPGGYCTQLNCGGGGCADEAACVLFDSAVPGCGFDDRSGPFGSRVARSFCMAKCESNGDCREGYVCADPRTSPWNAVILDDNQSKRACLTVPLEGQVSAAPSPTAKAPVCEPTAPPVSAIDASAPSIQAPGGGPIGGDAGADAGDAATDGG